MSEYNISYEIKENEYRTDSEWNGTLMMLFWDISNRAERLDEYNAMHLLEEGDEVIRLMNKAKRHRDNFQFKKGVRTLKKAWQRMEDAVKELDRKLSLAKLLSQKNQIVGLIGYLVGSYEYISKR